MAKIWEPQPTLVYQHWIKDILEESSDKLSDWESSFIENVESQLRYRNLTQAQAEKLESIYVKYTE